MWSFEAYGWGDELGGGEKISSGFVVTCGDDFELLEISGKILDQVSGFANLSIVSEIDLSIGFQGNHGGPSGRLNQVDNPFISVVGLVGEQHGGFHGRRKMIGAEEVVGLTAGEEKADHITKGIDRGVDFGAQSCSGAADGLVLAVFFQRRRYVDERAR